MATTTNYGWTTPDDTALVKDGASAIRTLGSSVDTTTKNLNPETTLGDLSFRSSTSNVNTRIPIGSSGQHLTVVAGVPAWSTASDQTPLTTKGDIFTFSTVDARLPVGTDGQVLTADSNEATGLKFATPASGSRGLNQIIPTSVAVGSGTATVGANGLITFTTVGTSLSVNGCFSGTYTNYAIVIDATNSSSYVFPEIRMRVGGTDNTTASSYILQRFTAQSTTVAAARLTANRFQDALAIDDSATNGIQIQFYRPFVATTTNISATSSFALSGGYQWNVAGTHNESTSYDGFTLIIATTTITGKMRIYGWQE